MQRQELARLIEPFDIAREEADELQRVLLDAPPGYGMTAVLLTVIDDVIAEHAPDKLDAMRTYRAQLPKSNIFAPYPLAPFVLTVVRMSTLLYPSEPLDDALYRGVAAAAPNLAQISIFQVFMKVAEGDIGVYLEQSMKNNALFQNFGVWDLERPAPNHIIGHCHDTAEAQLYVLPGYYEALYRVFGVQGSFKGEWLGNGRFDTEARWS